MITPSEKLFCEVASTVIDEGWLNARDCESIALSSLNNRELWISKKHILMPSCIDLIEIFVEAPNPGKWQLIITLDRSLYLPAWLDSAHKELFCRKDFVYLIWKKISAHRINAQSCHQLAMRLPMRC